MINPSGRYDHQKTESYDDGWETTVSDERRKTQIFDDSAGQLISTNRSPDIPFTHSINPYRGCEHGCAYCFARPSHAYLNLSPGLDFETKIFAKKNAAKALRAVFARPAYRPHPIVLGINTDAYQPVERRLRITRQLVELFSECAHPLQLITKSTLIERDLDLLAPMAAKNLVSVAISITTLDVDLNCRMEPRAAAPQRRLKIIERLSAAGIPTTVLVAPIIPGLTDHEIENIVQQSAQRGAISAGYMMLRLPWELRQLFPSWLTANYPERAERVLNALRQMHGGDIYCADYGHRMRGEGPYADVIAQRFYLARHRYGLDGQYPPLRADYFIPPSLDGQRSLF